jgi:DNA-binding NtrC family response regulator
MVLDVLTSMDYQNKQHTSPAEDESEPEIHRVLCVDDEPAICFAYSKLLEGERYKFDICENVEEAHSFLRNNNYFAVISDVRFAGSGNEDGVDFVSAVRKAQPHAEVILVTGYGSKELEQTVRILGASHYFEKPVKPSVILGLLQMLHMNIHKQEAAKI